MNEILKSKIESQVGQMIDHQVVQELWSGYGYIYRCQLVTGSTCIVKYISFPKAGAHPRGWNTTVSHDRKMRSYEVEMHWYRVYAQKCPEACRVAEAVYTEASDAIHLIIMQDLDAAGFAIRKMPGRVSLDDAKDCLRWLAHFHAFHLRHDGNGLWSKGTYWYLDTRLDEWNKMSHGALKASASKIDLRLDNCKYMTLLHGDAKLANFCFSESEGVAAVDFQYVGRGCGIKDVAYFISSVYEEDDCEKLEGELLDYYFDQLKLALNLYQGDVDTAEVIKEWRAMYDYAWADFYRFLDGWSPGHWKMHGYSKQIVAKVLK